MPHKVGVSKHTLYSWKAKYGGMEVSEAQEAKQLRDESARLKKLVAELSLDKDALQSMIRKTDGTRRDVYVRRTPLELPPLECWHGRMATRRSEEEIQGLLEGYRERSVTRAEGLTSGNRYKVMSAAWAVTGAAKSSPIINIATAAGAAMALKTRITGLGGAPEPDPCGSSESEVR